MKVVASDFDNTLYVKDENILLSNIESVKNFINNGNKFIIITGRSFTNIKKVLTSLEIPYSYLVCQDGANIFDEYDRCLKSNFLSREKSKNIAKILEENNLEYTYESAFNDNDIQDKAVKITVCVNNKEEAESVTKKIKEKENIYAYVSSKHINIIDDYVNKSSALEYLVKQNIISKDITVIGDDINDYEMLSKYHGVIMKKHHNILDGLNKEEIDSVGSYLNKLEKLNNQCKKK